MQHVIGPQHALSFQADVVGLLRKRGSLGATLVLLADGRRIIIPGAHSPICQSAQGWNAIALSCKSAR